MTDGIAIVIGSVVTAVIGGMVTISTRIIDNRQAERMVKLNQKVDEYHEAVNGNMGKLLETTAELAKAKGAQENQEQTDAKPQNEK